MTLPGRYDIAPLADAAGITLHTPGRPHDEPAGWTALAERLGISYHHVRHVARTGLTDRQADHWAIRLGHMPQAIWGRQWWDQAPDETDDFYSDDPPWQTCTPTLQRTMD